MAKVESKVDNRMISAMAMVLLPKRPALDEPELSSSVRSFSRLKSIFGRFVGFLTELGVSSSSSPSSFSRSDGDGVEALAVVLLLSSVSAVSACLTLTLCSEAVELLFSVFPDVDTKLSASVVFSELCARSGCAEVPSVKFPWLAWLELEPGLWLSLLSWSSFAVRSSRLVGF